MQAPRALLLAVALAASGCTLLELPPTPATTPSVTPTSMQSVGVPCANLTLALDRDVLSPGENVSIALTLTNCGTTLLPVLPPGPCARQESLELEVGVWGETSTSSKERPTGPRTPPSRTLVPCAESSAQRPTGCSPLELPLPNSSRGTGPSPAARGNSRPTAASSGA